MALLLVVFLATGCTARATATPTVECKLYLLAGQSNMAGRGQYGELPPQERALPENVELHAVSLDSRLREVEGRFGPELGLAQILAPHFADETLVLVKYAVDASSLLDWAPDWDRDAAEQTGHPEFGPLYHKLMDLVAEVGAGCQPAAVFWMQGERDARIPEAGQRYEQNLVELIDRFRADLGVTDLPFILGQVNPPPEHYPAVATVRAAQAGVVSRTPNTALVSTEGLTKLPDDLHYDTAGQIELGRRFAQAYQDLVGR